MAAAKPENRGLEGLRVLSLESRRAEQMAKLIETYGGVAVSAPSMREVPLAENRAVFAFAENLLAGNLEAAIFLTGVGTRILFSVMETRHARERLAEALGRVIVVARGPKPTAALRELGVPITVIAPEPNTWRDLLKALDEQPVSLGGKRIAVQEYGVSNRELLEALEARGAAVTAVPVYQWALPEDMEPLRRAIREIINGRIDVLLVTSANQIHNLLRVASESGDEERLRQGLRRAVVASIGPTSAETLREQGIPVDFEATHPKMGQLVFDAAQKAKGLLRSKR